ncbi:hypothetical protein L207DRAFT_149782 [Hyaloscypha variabilis F]|uniref:Uncharacterized protein n=1 Tax=Hyaloscypha variabilis (strain UAMH 11265 / GT02V1 / F) TaxID=1149755 RepID=A0A2J6S872_HYAVF|nr:hypothetical protein L207DRAFT_149782 [Hyaloscypha variabilis F]
MERIYKPTSPLRSRKTSSQKHFQISKTEHTGRNIPQPSSPPNALLFRHTQLAACNAFLNSTMSSTNSPYCPTFGKPHEYRDGRCMECGHYRGGGLNILGLDVGRLGLALILWVLLL